MSRGLATRGLLLALGLASSGCYCSGAAVFGDAASGRLSGVHELGEFATPLIPPPQSYQLETVDQAFAALAPHLEHADPFHRLVALEAVRRLGTRAKGRFRTKGFRALLDPLLRDPDPELRWRAAWALGRIEFFRPGLLVAAGDAHPRVAERAVWALGRVLDPPRETLAVLIAALDRPALRARARASLSLRTGRSFETSAEWRTWAGETGSASSQDETSAPPAREASSPQDD